RVQAKLTAIAVEEEAGPLNRAALLMATVPYGVGAVTLILVTVSLALAFMGWMGLEEQVRSQLLITAVPMVGAPTTAAHGLPEVGQFEFWRLITPCLVNVDVLPLL